MVYKISMTYVEQLKALISKYLRKWLGLNKFTSNVCLYGNCSLCPLPFTSVSSIFKTSKARGYLQLRYSTVSNQHVSNAGIGLRTVRKWSVLQEIDDVEQNTNHLILLGHTQVDRAGLGTGLSIPAKRTPQTCIVGIHNKTP